jgi:hypothetical protein
MDEEGFHLEMWCRLLTDYQYLEDGWADSILKRGGLWKILMVLGGSRG